MIERGREIIMEEVVFEQKPVETATKTTPREISPKKPSDEEKLIERSFVVTPATRADGLSLVSWWSTNTAGTAHQHHCWSNLDWSIFGTGATFVSGPIRYSLLCLPGTLPEGSPEEQKPPPRWLRPLPGMEPAYHPIPSPAAKRYRPDLGARRFMRDLHQHVAANHEELRTDLKERKLAGQARKERREAEKRQPKNIVIRFGLKPRATHPQEKPTTKPKR